MPLCSVLLYGKFNGETTAVLFGGVMDAEPATWGGIADRLLFLPDGCWGWRGATNGHGYAVVAAKGGGITYLHRLMYSTLRGPIPDGLQIDHLCRNRSCSNPDHLEPVTPMTNTHRSLGNVAKKHCPQGHAYSPSNTYIVPKTNRRHCRLCARQAQRRFWAKAAS